MQDELDRAAQLISRAPASQALATVERALAAIWERDEAHQRAVMEWVEQLRGTWRKKLHEIKAAEKLREEAARLQRQARELERHRAMAEEAALQRALRNPCGSQSWRNPSRCALERGHDGPHQVGGQRWENAQCPACARTYSHNYRHGTCGSCRTTVTT